MFLDGEVYVCNLKTNLAYKEIRSYLSSSAVLKEYLTMNKMVVNNNGSSNVNSCKKSTFNQMNQKQVKILSQSIIKAASLTSRKEFINKVLQNSDSKIKLLTKARTETNHQEDRKLRGRDDNELHIQRQENTNTNDRSSAERQIRNVQISKSDISKSISDSKESRKSNKQKRMIKMKQKKLEVVSESSDSENERENVHHRRKLKKQRSSNVNEIHIKKEIESEPSSSDSRSDSMRHKKESYDSVDKEGMNMYKKSEASSVDSESDSSCSRGSTYKSNSSRSDCETDVSKYDENKRISDNIKKVGNTKKVGTNKIHIKKEMSELSSSDSDNGSVKHNKNAKNSVKKEGINMNKESKLASVDAERNSSSSGESNCKSDSSSSDFENVSKNDKKHKRIFDKSKQSKSESSNSDSESDSSIDNERKTSADRGKQTTSNLNNSNRSDTSVSNLENKHKQKRKLSDIKSSGDEADELILKRRKYSVDSNHILSEPEKLLKAFAENNGYSQVVTKCEDLSDLLSDSEDVYLVQIPKCIDPRVLINKTVSFDRPTKLKIENESYVWDVNHEHKDVCIMNSNRLHNVSTKGTITLRQHLKSKSKCVQPKPLNNIPDTPHNLKVRHPLFGPDYKEKIELEADILAKLEEITAGIDKRHKKKKSKKKHKKEIETELPENLDIIKLLNERDSRMKEDNVQTKDATVKKNKKHKEKSKPHEVDNEIQTMISEMFPDIKKTKKKKRHSLEISTNPKDDKHKKNNSFPDTTSKTDQSPLKMSTTDYKSTKRKSKDGSHILHMEKKGNDYTKEESTSITSSEGIQHKRNRDKVLTSTILSPAANNILQLDESYIPKAKKKHKHRKSIDIYVDSLVKNMGLSDDAPKIKKKKRKRKHSDKTD